MKQVIRSLLTSFQKPPMWRSVPAKPVLAAVLASVSVISAVATAQPREEEASVLGRSARAEQIERAVRKEIDGGLFPGSVVLVGRPGKVLYHEAFGHARVVPDKVEMRKDSIFGLASITKVVATATAFGVCVDESLLDFDTPIGEAKASLPSREGLRDGFLRIPGPFD